MKPTLVIGFKKTERITVDEARTVGFMGTGVWVYATPELVRDIETVCRALLLEHLDADEDSVGTRIALDHLAATPEGLWVDIAVVLNQLEGRAAHFTITARDALDEVCRGEHIRVIIDKWKIGPRITEKRERVLGK